MTREELISLTIDKYTDLQRIKKSNGGVENKELDYQIKVTLAKLSSLGISVEEYYIVDCEKFIRVWSQNYGFALFSSGRRLC